MILRQRLALFRMMALTALVVLLLSGCAKQSAEYVNVSASAALELIDVDDVVIIDVREPEEFAAGHIPGAELIPLGTLANALGDLDKEQTYLLVCRSGNRSGQAAKLMIENGFTQVKNLRGGMNSWTGEVER